MSEPANDREVLASQGARLRCAAKCIKFIVVERSTWTGSCPGLLGSVVESNLRAYCGSSMPELAGMGYIG